jgi:hypothetical protein
MVNDMDSGCPSADVLRGGRSIQPVHLPAVFEDDDGTRAGGNGDANAQEAIRDAILDAYSRVEAAS